MVLFNQALADYPLPDGGLCDAWRRTVFSSTPERYYYHVYHIFCFKTDTRRVSSKLLLFAYLTAGQKAITRIMLSPMSFFETTVRASPLRPDSVLHSTPSRLAVS